MRYLFMLIIYFYFLGCVNNSASKNQELNVTEELNTTIDKGEITSILGEKKILIEDVIHLTSYYETFNNTLHQYKVILKGNEPQFIRFTDSHRDNEACIVSYIHIDGDNNISSNFGDMVRYKHGYLNSGEYMLSFKCDGEEVTDGMTVDYTLEIGTDSNFNRIFNDDEAPIIPDSDNDGRNDDRDNCKDVSNPSQSDIDEDGIGDVCDNSNDSTYIDTIELPTELYSIKRLIEKRNPLFLLNVTEDGIYGINHTLDDYHIYTESFIRVDLEHRGFAEGTENPWSHYLRKGKYILRFIDGGNHAGFIHQVEWGTDTDGDFIMDIKDSCVDKKNYFMGDVKNIINEEDEYDTTIINYNLVGSSCDKL